MEDDLWVETEEDRVFLEEETLSFMMRSSNKRVAVREDAVVDCLDDKEQVPENKDDLGRDSVSKDDLGSSWTDEESFERLVDEYDGDSTPQEVGRLLSPPDILTTRQDDKEGSSMVNDQQRPCTAPIKSRVVDPLMGGTTEGRTGLGENNCSDDERPFVDRVTSSQLLEEDMVEDDRTSSTVPADDQQVGQDDGKADDEQDGGREEDAETTTTPEPSIDNIVNVKRYTGKDRSIITNDTLCLAPLRDLGTQSEHNDPSPTTHGPSSTPASHPDNPGNTITPGNKADIPASQPAGAAGGLVLLKKSEVKCEYWKGGVCVHHGPGAKKKWRPKGTKTIVDKNGVSRKVCIKENYYVCDPVSRGREKMNQTVLSFTKPTQRNNNNLMFGMESDDNTTPSVGQ